MTEIFFFKIFNHHTIHTESIFKLARKCGLENSNRVYVHTILFNAPDSLSTTGFYSTLLNMRVSPQHTPISENAANSNFSKQPLISKRDYYGK